MTIASKVAATVITLAVVVGIVIGGYQLGWWLRENEVNRGAEIRRGSFEYQETRRDEVVRQSETLASIDVQLTTEGVTAEQRNALTAQRVAVARQMCNIAADLGGDVSPAVEQTIREECA